VNDTCLIACHAQDTTPQLDVVFVHGLKGDPRDTWQGQSENGDPTFWPEWLAQDVAGVGVWSFGYSSTLTDWFSQTLPIASLAGNLASRLRDKGVGVGDRPVVFVGHSMGGLIVKHMLTDMANHSNPELAQLWPSTDAVMFLGTPHAGSELAVLSGYLGLCANVLSGGWLDVGKALVGLPGPANAAPANLDELKFHAPALAALNTSFMHLTTKRHAEGQFPRVIAYRETQTLHGVMVVDKHSADPHIAGAEVVDLPFDHLQMCKLSTREASPFCWLKRTVGLLNTQPRVRPKLPRGTVFISHVQLIEVSGPMRFDQDVANLVFWLRAQGVQVRSSLDYFWQKAPEGGWPNWRDRSVAEAHTVLVLGHRHFPSLFGQQPRTVKKDDFIENTVTSAHFDAPGISRDKFVPLLKDGEPKAYLPVVMEGWWNGARYPSCYQSILNAICSTAMATPNGGSE
jgi:pimeloyl-ACP methyl ester carboxylesterase